MMLTMIQRERDAILNENNTVFVDLYDRIAAKQRQKGRSLAPIAEETSDLPSSVHTAIVSRQPQDTNRWAEFDPDDEELPDVSSFLPGWVNPSLSSQIVEPQPLVASEALQETAHEEGSSQDPAWWRIKQPAAAVGWSEEEDEQDQLSELPSSPQEDSTMSDEVLVEDSELDCAEQDEEDWSPRLVCQYKIFEKVHAYKHFIYR